MPAFTIENVIRETYWLAPEAIRDEAFMEEWSHSKWGVGYKQVIELKQEDEDASNNTAC